MIYSAGALVVRVNVHEMYSTSKRSAETASHPNGTANSQNICVTIRVLLTQETQKGRGRNRGVKDRMRENEA